MTECTRIFTHSYEGDLCASVVDEATGLLFNVIGTRNPHFLLSVSTKDVLSLPIGGLRSEGGHHVEFIGCFGPVLIEKNPGLSPGLSLIRESSVQCPWVMAPTVVLVRVQYSVRPSIVEITEVRSDDQEEADPTHLG